MSLLLPAPCRLLLRPFVVIFLIGVQKPVLPAWVCVLGFLTVPWQAFPVFLLFPACLPCLLPCWSELQLQSPLLVDGSLCLPCEDTASVYGSEPSSPICLGVLLLSGRPSCGHLLSRSVKPGRRSTPQTCAQLRVRGFRVRSWLCVSRYR